MIRPQLIRSALRRFAPLLCGVGLLASMTGCAASRAENGALAGTLVGGALGAAVGEANDNPLAGAVIGGLGGALVGGAIGEANDRADRNAVARASYERDMAAAHANRVTIDEAIQLTLSGVDPEVIATHVRQRGGCGPLSAADLITLQQNGVHPRVVTALQTSSPPPVQGPIATPRDRVIVQEIHHGPGWGYCDPDPFCDPHFYHYRRRHRHHHVEPGVSFGLHFD
ncbi:glycine zipper domain-containing protein [Alienimonas californiensis]|uniref:glycine zipper domain-containing protein n=1 Tax=Alienimonas californiensis TaxID=2527989 RepID=UPI0013FD0357|nr:glycine zipper domain-containing protein [Alienimonas californiensis]